MLVLSEGLDGPRELTRLKQPGLVDGESSGNLYLALSPGDAPHGYDHFLLVNGCGLTMTQPDGKVVYKNALATNYPISDARHYLRGSHSLEGGKRKQQHFQNQGL